jgi:hypothetical protein
VNPSGISGASIWYWPGKEAPGTYCLCRGTIDDAA